MIKDMEAQTPEISTVNPPPLDTLAIAKFLKQEGVGDREAEAHAEVLGQLVTNNLATKTDIALIQRDIADVQRDIKEMENRLIIKLGSIMVGVVAFFEFMDKFF